MKKMKKVLIMNISYNDIGMMKALKKMGYYIYAIGMYSGLPGQEYADEYIRQDYSQKEEVLKLAIKLQVDAVCACCNDTGVITAAYVAEKLGLNGHDTYNNALLLEHKDKFNAFLQTSGIQKSNTQTFNTEKEALSAVRTMLYPIIIKPVDLCGGVGISKAETVQEAESAVKNAFALTRESNIVIEPFISGKQYGLCTFLVNKKVVKYCTNNEMSVVNPYRVEMDLFPSDCEPELVSDLIKKIEKIATILQLKDGIFHLQFLVHNKQAHIIEAMRRVPGNLYLKLAKEQTGFDWDYWEARTHCGIDCEKEIQQIKDTKLENGCGAYRSVVAEKNGVVKKLRVAPEVQKYITEQMIFCEKGQKVQHHKTEQLALLFFRFPDRKSMEHILLDEYDKIGVELEA